MAELAGTDYAGNGTSSISEQIDALTDPNFMTSFARGLAVLRALSNSHQPKTVVQISQHTGIPRSAVRRCLYTLDQMGYVGTELNNFGLRPKVLTLGHSYLSSAPLIALAQPCLEKLSGNLRESCSLAVLDENQVLYVARSVTSRVWSVSLGAGMQLPAYCTSPGRVLLAGLNSQDLDRYLAQVPLLARTEYTVTSPAQLREILSSVRREGYAINSEELEVGLRSIAVPVRCASGQVRAALIVGMQATRVSADQMVEKILPVLRQAADELTIQGCPAGISRITHPISPE